MGQDGLGRDRQHPSRGLRLEHASTGWQGDLRVARGGHGSPREEAPGHPEALRHVHLHPHWMAQAVGMPLGATCRSRDVRTWM